MKNALIYDIEIVKAIRHRDEWPEDGIQYCDGWHDFTRMGVSVVGCYDYAEGRYRVFCEDNKREFRMLLEERGPLCVGFNNIAFDNAVLVANGWPAPNDAMCY